MRETTREGGATSRKRERDHVRVGERARASECEEESERDASCEEVRRSESE